MAIVRHPAVAGTFYPADPGVLRRLVRGYLEAAGAEPHRSEHADRFPKAIIVPHAGYLYSGAVAASAYVRLRPGRDRIRRVVLLGPAHYHPFGGLALPAAEWFETPLGRVPLEAEAARDLARFPQVRVSREAHAPEHSLEVHVPFLQEVLEEFTLVPLVVGDAEPDEVAEVLDRLWGGPETLIVVSTDLSHYHDYETARRLDAATARDIERQRWEDLRPDRACGCAAVRGLLRTTARRESSVHTVDLRSSGDTAGPRDQVVGYGAWVIEEASVGGPPAAARM